MEIIWHLRPSLRYVKYFQIPSTYAERTYGAPSAVINM